MSAPGYVYLQRPLYRISFPAAHLAGIEFKKIERSRMIAIHRVRRMRWHQRTSRHRMASCTDGNKERKWTSN